MNENEHNNFKDLKRLMKLMRHEVPPPGFFNDFSGEIIARIRAGEAQHSDTLAERLKDSAPWLINFIRLFEARPGLIGAAATGLCLLLVLGVVLAEQADSGPKTMLTGNNAQPAESLSLASSGGSPSMSMADPLLASGITISSNPVTSLQPVASFGQPSAGAFFQPASFAPGH